MDDSPDSKRPQSDVEGEYEDEVPPKRRALNRDDEDEDEMEEEEVRGQDDDEEEDAREEEPEDGDDEEEEEETDRRRNSEARRQVNAPGRPPEAGVITKIYVENFMCHRKFEVNLCRNVNFITGQNGSGKSAILAAIQICLGAGARKTHRARNLKDLVRKDATTNAPTHAKIQVKLLNRGADAFHPDVYGETITVERTITLRSGFNGYKLLDHDGKEQSRSKKDLDAMLDQLNIQVENPVAVLDQEEAKKFLTGKPQDKYNFFMKATELARVSSTFSGAIEHQQELTDAKEKIDASLETKRNHVKELKRRWEEHQALDKYKAQLLEAQTNFSWAYYQSVVEQYDDAVDKLRQMEERTEQKEQDLADFERSLGNPDDEEQARRDKVQEISEEARKQTDLKMQLEADLRALVAPKKQLERKQHSLKKDRKSKEKALRLAKQRLQQVRDEILEKAGSAESEEARRTAELKEKEEELAQCKDKVGGLRQDVATNLRKYEELEPHVQHSKTVKDNLEAQIKSMEGKIRSLESSNNDSLALFGQKVRQVYGLVAEAKRKGKFRGPVVGPVGHYIKVVPGKEEFAAVAEHAIGGSGTLDRFIVTNDDDRVLLQSLRRKASCSGECNIWQINNKPRFNISEPPAGVDTVATVYRVENDLVFNGLVDFSKIDQKALGRDRPSSEQKLLYRNEKGEDAIRGIVKEVYLLPDGTFWTVKNGSKAIFSNSRKLKKTIGTDMTQALADANADLEEKDKELQRHRQEDSKLEHEHSNYQRGWNNAKKANRDNDKKIADLTNDIEEIRTAIETSGDVTVDTTEFEQDVANAEEELESLDQEEVQIAKEIEDCEPEIAEAAARVEECAARNDKVMKEMHTADQELTQLLESKTQRENQLDKKRKKLEKYRAGVEQLREQEQAFEASKLDSLTKARQLTYRSQLQKEYSSADPGEGNGDILRKDPTDEELDAIEVRHVQKGTEFWEHKIDKMKTKIQREKERRNVKKDDPAVAFEKYRRGRQDYEDSKKQSTKIEVQIGQVESDMKKRKKLWKKMRSHLELTTGDKFAELLSLNKYSGSVEFDHGTNSLDILVKKEAEAAESQGGSDVKSLSGGERSYTTMCLLLALGEKLETPFRILDEYDVFLDGPTRKLTTRVLVKLAREKMAHRQFIFITPQDVSFLDPAPDLKLLKLNPPKRHGVVGGPTQSTLDFSQEEEE